MARCLAGDTEAFRPLVQQHQRVVFSVAYRMLGSRADAEDVAQQAFADAYAALDRFRSEGRKNAFSTWVIRITINRCKDVLKSKKRTEESLDGDVAGREAMFAHDTRDPESHLAAANTRQALEAALLRVPDKYREVLVLKDVEELSYEEIQGILGLPITTLKIRVVRARAMLRALIEGGEAMKPSPSRPDDDQPFPGLAALKDVDPAAVAGAGGDAPDLRARTGHLLVLAAAPAPAGTAAVAAGRTAGRRRGDPGGVRAGPVGPRRALWADVRDAGAPAPGAPALAGGAGQPADVVLVRFVLAARGAKQVAVAGDFNAWDAGATVLVDADGQGTFVATVPLRKGAYEYMFLVDGKWMTDPTASETRPDGFGRANAILRL